MLVHARAAVPFRLLCTAITLVALLLAVVERWPYTLWPLQGIAVGLLAGTAVWCFDEPAAAIVDTLPRPLRWRTLARGLAVLALLALWLLMVVTTRQAYLGHASDVALQGVATVLAAVAYVTYRRSRGSAKPAQSTSALLVTCATFFALARPLEDRVVVFPFLSEEAWQQSRVAWCVVAVGALLVLALTHARPRIRTSTVPTRTKPKPKASGAAG